uniref:hydroxyacylglutathione hydrolase n=1 Tax=Ditylenchus dipsaci TaxID=166011 RepID=A0A915EA20_9BILA
MISRFLRKVAVNFQQVRNMKVVPIPANEDNYQYLIIDEKTNVSAIVDPVDVDSILKTAKSEGSNLIAALVTHHHWDHAGGTEAIAKASDGIIIYGGDADRIASINKVLNHRAEFKIGDLRVKALSTPCHTSTHICYYITDQANNERAVFTGDTLFIGGCGRSLRVLRSR